MTQRDHEAWLNRARQALSPNTGDQARVLAALEQRLHLPSSAPSSPAAEQAGHGAANRLDQPLSALQTATLQTAIKTTLGGSSALAHWALAALVPLTAAAAFSLLVTTRSTAPVNPTRSSQTVAATVTQASLPEALTLVAEVEVKNDPPAPKPEAAPIEPNQKKPPRKKCRTAQGYERPCATVRSSASALALGDGDTRADAHAPPARAAKPTVSLSQELAALREAQSALRAGQPAQALEVLASFERESAVAGVMQEERSAAATMARCALARAGEAASGSAQALYQSFLQRHPQSAYAARLRRICLPKPQSPQ